jgi:hypothetical protein
MPTNEQLQNLNIRMGALREKLVDELGPRLLENPQLGDALERYIDNLLEGALKASAQPPPPDGGLAQLVGLGSDAVTSLGAAQQPEGVQDYDDSVTSERIQAVADLYYLYQHERVGIFSAVLKLQELFRAGTVRLSHGPGALGLYRYDRRRVLRYTQIDRLQAYRRVFGYTTTPPAAGAHSNDRFHALFVHFVTQVAEFYRDKRVSEVIRPRANDPSFGSIAIVRRAGLDLRNNVKHASYGHVAVLRIEMLQLLDEAFTLLNQPDVRNLFGAENAWDVVEEVMRQYLGRPQINASQRNRMAVAGRDILIWLSQPHILNTTRAEFEALLVDIADRAEEWMTSAEAAGLTQTRSGVRRGRLPGIDRPMSATQAAQGAAPRPAQGTANLGAVPVMANGRAPGG